MLPHNTIFDQHAVNVSELTLEEAYYSSTSQKQRRIVAGKLVKLQLQAEQHGFKTTVKLDDTEEFRESLIIPALSVMAVIIGVILI